MLSVFSITDFGAVADGTTDDSAAIQRAIDAAHAAGGGRVLIPEGVRTRAGSFELKSNVDFHVAENAVLLSATTLEAFPNRVFGTGEEAEKRRWIGARDGTHITLSGRGTIDGQCRAFALGENEHIFTPTLPWRPALTCFENVHKITVRDLTFRNAANWTLHFTGCEDVSVHDVRIFNDPKFPNADGIDPDHCRRVRITDCHIIAADDCIVLKNTAAFAHYGACEDIEISHCRLESVSAAFKIGSESHGDFRRIRVHDCTIVNSNRGLAMQLRDHGSIEDAEFRDITIQTRRFSPVFWGAGEAIYITALPRKATTKIGSIRNIRFHNIHCAGENGLVVYSAPPGRIDGLELANIHVGIERHSAWPSGVLDVRPFQDGYQPRNALPCGERTPWGYPVECQPAALTFEGVGSVSFHKVTCSLPIRDTVPWIPLLTDHPLPPLDGGRT